MSGDNSVSNSSTSNYTHHHDDPDEMVDLLHRDDLTGEDTPLAALVNILDDNKASKASKRKTALNHFNDFLYQYWRKLRPAEEAAPSSQPLYEFLKIEELNHELFGCFANYLAKDGYNKQELKKGNYVNLSLNSAIGYFSAIKIYFKDHPNIRNLDYQPRIFSKDQWSNLSNKLTGAVVERHKTSGTPLVNPKAAATTMDWIALACTCVWVGEQNLLEFWSVFVSLTHFAARVNEPAFLKFEHGKTTMLRGAGNTSNRVAQYCVTNYKQCSQQTMHVFPHIEHWQLDFFFSQAVFFACSNGTSDFVFPTYGAQGQKESADSNSKDSSKIVKHFTSALQKCKNWFERNKTHFEQCDNLPNELSKGICSHSGKKYAVREMGRELNPVYVIFRAGWAVRNAHTIFDYLVKDIVHDVKAAKICAGWNTKWYEDIWGGFNNQVEDLGEDVSKFLPFCQALFPYQHDKMDRELMFLHGLSVLRFYKDFERCINSCPVPGSTASGNQFVSQVKEACQAAGVSDDIFAKWQHNVKEAFIRKNCYALSLKDAPEMHVDSKPLLEQIGQLTTVVAENAHKCNTLIEMCQKLVNLNTDQKDRIERLEKMIQTMGGRGSRLPVVPGVPTQQPGDGTEEEAMDGDDNQLGPDAAPTPIPGERRKSNMCYDNILLARYGNKPIPVNKLFVSWFVEQLPVAYDNYKATRPKSHDREAKNHHKKVKSHFSITKTAIHVVLKNLTAYPTGKETPEMLEEMANEALNNIKSTHSLPVNSVPSRTLLGGKKSLFKSAGYIGKDFPPNTPSQVQEWFQKRGISNMNHSNNTQQETVEETQEPQEAQEAN